MGFQQIRDLAVDLEGGRQCSHYDVQTIFGVEHLTREHSLEDIRVEVVEVGGSFTGAFNSTVKKRVQELETKKRRDSMQLNSSLCLLK